MALKRIDSTKDIPWFRIENYNYISELSDIDLLNEFSRRRELYNNRDTILMEIELLSCYWKGILSGKPNTNALLEKKFSDEDEDFNNYIKTLPEYEQKNYQSNEHLLDDVLSYDEAISPIEILQIIEYNKKIEIKGIYKKDKEFSYFKDDTLYSSISKIFNDDVVACEIDLSSHTDDEIIASLKGHLPKWRKKMEVPEPEKRFIKSSEVSKIKAYKIIPLLDLMIWGGQTDSVIPNRVLASCVNPFGDVIGSEDLSGGNAKVSKLLNTLLCDNLSLTNITGEF